MSPNPTRGPPLARGPLLSFQWSVFLISILSSFLSIVEAEELPSMSSYTEAFDRSGRSVPGLPTFLSQFPLRGFSFGPHPFFPSCGFRPSDFPPFLSDEESRVPQAMGSFYSCKHLLLHVVFFLPTSPFYVKS